MKAFLLILSLFLVGSVQAQTDTSSQSSGYFLTFVKKVYLNPTVYLRCQQFKETTNIGFVALPDLNSAQNNASSGFEKGLQKLLRLLMQTDGGIRFYFNPDTPTAPFSFWSTDNLWCKFQQPQKDSINYYLNHNFSDGNLDLNNNQRFENTIDETLDYIQRVLAANTASCGDEPQNETTTINTKPLAINLHNTSGSKYDIDYKKYDALASNYAVATDVFTNQEWYAPSKMFVAGGGTEPVVMSISLHDPQFKKENLKIEILRSHTVLQFTYSNDSVRFNLPSDLVPSDPVEVVVKYKSLVDSVNYTVGLFMINVVEQQTPKLILLGANGYSVSPTDVANIKTYLDKVYKPVGVSFEVSSDAYVFPNDYPTMIQDEGSGLLSNYPSDLHDFVGDVKDLDDYDSDNYYLVLGLNNTNTDLLGYMPRARNIGFIFFPTYTTNTSPYKLSTIAHEIGHGAFHLRHIFDTEELGENYYGATHNLMDYSDVIAQEALYVHQWNLIKDPAFVSWMGGDDDDAQGNVGPTSGVAEYLRNADKKTVSFVTPGGKVISFQTSKLTKYHFHLYSNNINEIALPIGVLESFTYNDTAYYMQVTYDNNNPLGYTFYGYSGKGVYFVDKIRPTLDAESKKTACMLVYRQGFYDYVKFDIGNLSNPAYNHGSNSESFDKLSDFPFKPYNTIEVSETGYVKDFNEIISGSMEFKIRANNLEYLTVNHLTGSSKECAHYLVLAQIMDIASYDDELFHYFTQIGKFNNWEEEGVVESAFEGLAEISSGLDLNSGFDERVEGNVGGLYTKFTSNPWGLYQQDFIPEFLEFRANILANLNSFWTDFSSNKFANFGGTVQEQTQKRDAYNRLLRMVVNLSTSSVLENLSKEKKIDAVQVLMSTNDYFTGDYESLLVKLLKCVKQEDANFFLFNLESRSTVARSTRPSTNLTAFIFDNVHNVGFGEQYTEVTLELIRISLSSSDRAQEYQNRFLASNLDFSKVTVPFYYTGFWREVWHSINPFSAPSFDTESNYSVEGSTGKCKVSFTSYKYHLNNITAPVYVASGETAQLISSPVTLSAFDLINVENNSEDITFAQLIPPNDSVVLVPAFAVKYMDDEGFSKTVCDGVEAALDVISIASGVGAVFSTLSKARKVIALVDALGGALNIANSASNGQIEVLSEINTAVGLLNLGFGAVDFVRSFRAASSAVDATATMINQVGDAAHRPSPAEIGNFVTSVDNDLSAIRASNDINGKLTLYMLLTRFEEDYKIRNKIDAAYQKMVKLKERLGNNWKNLLTNLPLSDFNVPVIYRQTVDAFSGFADLVGTQLKIGNQVIGEFTGGVLNLVTGAANTTYVSLKCFIKKATFGIYTDVPIFVAKRADGIYECVREGACFTKETKVKTKNGYLNINEIQVGDSVLSYDDQTRQMTYSKVTTVFNKFTSKLQRLVIGRDTIWTTPDHLFKTVFNDWIPAKNLVAGTLLLLANDSMAVQSNYEKDSVLTVYNFEVEGTHTYTVGKGNIIVHNDCEWFKLLNLSTENMEKLRLLKLENADFITRMKTAFGESSESVEKFLKFMDDNPDLAAKFKNQTLSIKAWKSISKLPPSFQSFDNIKAIGAYEALRPGSLADIERVVGSIKSSRRQAFLNGIKRSTESNGLNLTNKRIATPDEIGDAVNKIREFRSGHPEIAGDKNIGSIDGIINEQPASTLTLHDEWISGADNTPLTTTPVWEAELATSTTSGSTFLRNEDSEYMMLNYLARKLEPNAVEGLQYASHTGEIRIISEISYCTSCQGIIQKFNNMFPGIKITLIDGIK